MPEELVMACGAIPLRLAQGGDPGTHTTESLRTRVEAFAELLRSRKTMAR
ncbi:MAG: hypothetical protein V2J25_03185 [Desulfatiglans sp.]|nr:hypothetical protein [Thermodesulfobacteriota bacterium]MEE4351849.1 hypothetical protein [Desulfatiglans sp.]